MDDVPGPQRSRPEWRNDYALGTQFVENLLEYERIRGARLSAKARSRLNSAAPYNTQAWPPITRARSFFRWIKERALAIRLWFKRPAHQQKVFP